MVKKKIIIDLSWLDHSKTGGGEYQALNIINILLKKEFLIKYDIIFFTKPDILNRNNFKFLKNFEIIKLTNFSYFNYLIIFFISPFILKIRRIDIFFSTNIYIPMFKFFRFKTIVSLNHPLWIEKPELCSYIKRIIYNIYYKSLKSRSDLLICSNKIVKKIFDKKFKYTNTIVINIPIYKINSQSKHEKIRKKIKKLKNKVFYFTLSSLEDYKNIEILKKISKKVFFKNNAIIVFAGRRSHNKIFDTEFFKDLGEINETEKNWLYNHCNIYIHPSLYEGFGMILVEAMKMYKPIICTNTEVMRHVTGNCANYINKPKKEMEWLQKIQNVKNIKKNNYKKIIKRYSLPVIKKQYIKVLKNF